MKKMGYLWSAMAILMLLLSQGCSNQPGTEKKDSTVSSMQNAGGDERQNMILYLPTDDAQGVKAKVVMVKKEDYTPLKSLDILIEEENKKSFSVFTKNMKATSVKVNDEIAFVELNEAFFTEAKSGSLEEQLLVASMVNTLTEFEGVKKVQFLRDGIPITTINGHMDLGNPVSRMTDSIVK